MNRPYVLALIGFGVGVGFASLIFLAKRPAPAPASPAVSPAKLAAPEPAPAIQEPAVAPETAPAPPAKVESAPQPAAQPPFDFKAAFAKVSQKGLGAYGSGEMRELADHLKYSGTNGVRMVTDQLQSSTSPQEKFLLAGLLETLGDPSALPALETMLKNDSDLLVRRMASHAAAVIGTDAAVDILRPAMVHDEDWGVRVNSAYGLAKLKQQDGLDALQQYYSSAETPAEYRLAILGGLADVAAPSTGPMFRQILNDTTDAGYVLIAIGALEKMKDVQAVSDLQRIAASAKSDTIRQAAQRAIDNIGK